MSQQCRAWTVDVETYSNSGRDNGCRCKSHIKNERPTESGVGCQGTGVRSDNNANIREYYGRKHTTETGAAHKSDGAEASNRTSMGLG